MQRRRETRLPTADGLRVSDLWLHVFDRSIHPELFDVRRGVAIERGPFSARVYLTAGGHFCSFSWGRFTLSQTLCSKRQSLPKRRKRLEKKLVDGLAGEQELHDGATYAYRLKSRRCDPAEFVERQQAALDEAPATLIDAGERPDRWHGLRSLSWMRYDLQEDGMIVRAFHALPADYSIVESTARFTLPRQ